MNNFNNSFDTKKGETNKNYLKSIIKNIVFAQYCSDAAKGIFTKDSKYLDDLISNRYAFYAAKDTAIHNAIKLINNYKGKEVRYFIKKGLDQNDYPCVIIYFNICLDGTFYQVSFHSPNIEEYKAGGKPTLWTGIKGQSRRNCHLLAKRVGA